MLQRRVRTAAARFFYFPYQYTENIVPGMSSTKYVVVPSSVTCTTLERETSVVGAGESVTPPETVCAVLYVNATPPLISPLH